MTTVYELMRQRCGLSQQEAASFHGVRIDTVKSWCAGRNPANEQVLKELRALYQLIVHASGVLGARIDSMKGDVFVGLAQDDTQARDLGFPAAGAHHAAIGMAIAALGDGPRILLVPWRTGVETARSTRLNNPTEVARLFKKYGIAVDAEIEAIHDPQGSNLPFIAFRSDGKPLQYMQAGAAMQIRDRLLEMSEPSLALELGQQIEIAKRMAREAGRA